MHLLESLIDVIDIYKMHKKVIKSKVKRGLL